MTKPIDSNLVSLHEALIEAKESYMEQTVDMSKHSDVDVYEKSSIFMTKLHRIIERMNVAINCATVIGFHKDELKDLKTVEDGILFACDKVVENLTEWFTMSEEEFQEMLVDESETS